MKRVAILGGGISGLAAAYECEKLGLDWHLFEASDRLGGILQTTRVDAPEGRYILEGGPDGWVSEKPWLRELAVELGLEEQLIPSKDETRKTWILIDGDLRAVPDAMRMMVPMDLAALEASPLFSAEAKAAYAAEPGRAEELKAAAAKHDESVAAFVRRHFGEEVLAKVAAPLLSGVFGGDVHKLSVRAVMPQFVAMEREYGSLIVGLQAKRRGEKAGTIFTSLRDGMQTIVEGIVARLPKERIEMSPFGFKPGLAEDGWRIYGGIHFVPMPGETYHSDGPFDHLLVTCRGEELEELVEYIGRPKEPLYLEPGSHAAELLPTDASSAVIAALAWTPEAAATFRVPEGFGFLVPPDTVENSLMAATFVDQKFPQRCPAGARVMRAFFGGAPAETLRTKGDAEVVAASMAQLRAMLGPMPEPAYTSVQRWPRSLPQYEVGHLERMAELDRIVANVPGLTLLGNSYRGVGMPDLIRDARAAARKIVSAA